MVVAREKVCDCEAYAPAAAGYEGVSWECGHGDEWAGWWVEAAQGFQAPGLDGSVYSRTRAVETPITALQDLKFRIELFQLIN